ncbi:hypothetical protein GIB67_038049 [Kingdonia uniflora]|uniref:DOG1 domain-containing protein n=1 Tax=Kingdonia uniflora TaxID=39325 RepID=A0A7J7MC02_9MAGN|nr:hypothetical protein GIB67_038049 [Kingdonia uniflora]
MVKIFVTARIGRKNNSRPFKEFYEEWIETLNKNLLPLLRRSMLVSSANNLSANLQTIHHHFNSYYQALDHTASHDVAQLLHPNWRNTLEYPFLFLGDFHPYLFINLLRSFVNNDENHPTKNLMSKIEQIECGLRLMVPSLVARSRKSQSGFVDRVAVDWVRCDGRQEVSKNVGEAVMVQMEELIGVFLDANRLRRSVLAEIMGATDVYLAALYLEALSEFYVGFRDAEFLREFEQCKIPLSHDS